MPTGSFITHFSTESSTALVYQLKTAGEQLVDYEQAKLGLVVDGYNTTDWAAVPSSRLLRLSLRASYEAHRPVFSTIRRL
ncbi:hypothetical protein EG68_02597 [Paragonimus skrjabini miyazakii]|uniref:Uncharacterized protein n=1 Tax=Paragonimus skrjabini miyazakii TaxID=59628 RepID=A0A8S9ZA73_9TREM|nr:hypothetical protein EG68_02597 [Paragonimus skrjabini miyazakii]